MHTRTSKGSVCVYAFVEGAEIGKAENSLASFEGEVSLKKEKDGVVVNSVISETRVMKRENPWCITR